LAFGYSGRLASLVHSFEKTVKPVDDVGEKGIEDNLKKCHYFFKLDDLYSRVKHTLDGDVPQGRKRGQAPFLELSLLVNISEKKRDYPPSLKKGPVPFFLFYKVVPWGTSPIFPIFQIFLD